MNPEVRALFPGAGGRVYLDTRPVPDGRTELRLTPLELLERLARLIPPPRLHRHRYHGVLAPNAKLRAAVIAIGRPDVDASEDEATAPVHDAASDNGPARAASRARIRWAVLLARVDRLSREDRTFFVTLLRQHARSERVRLISPFEFEEDVQSIVAGRSDREPEQTRALTRVPLAARYHLRTLDELLTRQDGEGTSH